MSQVVSIRRREGQRPLRSEDIARLLQVDATLSREGTGPIMWGSRYINVEPDRLWTDDLHNAEDFLPKLHSTARLLDAELFDEMGGALATPRERFGSRQALVASAVVLASPLLGAFLAIRSAGALWKVAKSSARTGPVRK